MSDLDGNPVPTNAAESDVLLEQIYSQSDAGISDTAPPPTPALAPEDAAKRAAATDPLVEFTWRGEKRTAPQSKIMQWAQQGYDYGHLSNQLKEDQARLTTERSDFEANAQSLGEYTKVQEWAKQNPTLWSAAKAAHDQSTSQTAVAENPAIGQLSEQVQALSDQINGIQSKHTQDSEKVEDEELDATIQGVKDSDMFKGMDWATADENGRTLSDNIVGHAVERNIGFFEDAAKIFLFDKLLELNNIKVKEQASNELRANNRLGLAPIGKPKTKQINQSEGNSSYDDLANEALAEMAAGELQT